MLKGGDVVLKVYTVVLKGRTIVLKDCSVVFKGRTYRALGVFIRV